MTTRELQRLIGEAANASDQKRRVQLYQVALAKAIENGDQKAEFKIRYTLVTDELFDVSNTELSLACFMWCLAKLDENASEYARPSQVESLMWSFKWIVEMLGGSAAFSRDQIEHVLADMERRYRAQGYGDHAVVTTRHLYAWTTGLVDEADRLMLKMERTPRDEMSDCEACVAAQRVAFASDLRRDEAAVAEFDAMLQGSPFCTEQPEVAKAHVLMPMARTGHTQRAAALFKEAYEGCRTREKLLDAVARCTAFAAVTGNEAAALGMIERHLGWLDHDPLDGRGHFYAAACFHVALARLERLGHGETRVRIPRVAMLDGVAPGLERDATVSGLRTACAALAERLAREMDERNGNDAWSRELAALTGDIDIEVRIALESAPFNPLAGHPAEPADAHGWLMRARGLRAAARWDEALSAAERAASEDASVAPEALAVIASLKAGVGDGAAVDAAVARRVDAMEAVGHPAARLIATHGVALAHTDTITAEALERIYVEATDTPGAQDIALQVAISAVGILAGDDPQTARQWSERATQLLEHASDAHRSYQYAMVMAQLALHEADAAAASESALKAVAATKEPLLKAVAELFAAQTALMAGDAADAARLADSATHRFAAQGSNESAARACADAGDYWLAAGEFAAALYRLEYALPRLEGDGGHAMGMRVAYAEALVGLGREEEACATVQPVLENLVPDEATWRVVSRALWIAVLEADDDHEMTESFGRAVALARTYGQPADQAVAYARWYDALDDLYEDPDEKSDDVVAGLHEAMQTLDSDDPARAECVVRLLRHALDNGDPADTFIDVALQSAAALEVGPLTSRLTQGVAEALLESNQVSRAIEVTESELDRAASQGMDDPKLLQPAYMTLMACAHRVKDTPTAERLYRRCLEFTDGPRWFADVATDGLASVLKKTGRGDEAPSLS